MFSLGFAAKYGASRWPTISVPAGGSQRRKTLPSPHRTASSPAREPGPPGESVPVSERAASRSILPLSCVPKDPRLTGDGQCGHHDYMGRVASVGARELKTRLGGYLQQVRQGRTLVITERGQPVAELKPLYRAGTEDAELERLKTLGAVTRLENRTLAPFRPVWSRGSSISDAILEDRDDRV